jgi:hypothetical protein
MYVSLIDMAVWSDLEQVGYECTDTGAFYTCGQVGTGRVNLNNSLINNTFTRTFHSASAAASCAIDYDLFMYIFVCAHKYIHKCCLYTPLAGLYTPATSL